VVSATACAASRSAGRTASSRRSQAIAGNPAAPTGRGTICTKGLAAPHLLYDPYRVNYPLKRTNPEKGLNVDPKFVRISWEEALDTIDKKLRECQARDPRGLFFQATTTQASEIRASSVS
jgi:anaerobic selenocysteine-containing dehydrogenase